MDDTHKNIDPHTRHQIDQILADFTVYIEPKLLKDDVTELLNVAGANIDSIKKYRQLLSNIKYAWQKVLRYKFFFATFYTADNAIDKVEALNHNIHAYLQDMDTLKNKIMVFLEELKKDLKKVASNKDEVIVFIDAGRDKTLEVFDGVLKYRRPHVHNGMRFMDGDLLKAENAHETIKMFTETPMAEMLNPDYKDEWFNELAIEKETSFETAKSRWITMAESNDEQTTGYLNSLFETIRPSINQLLGITSVMDVLEKNKQENHG
jgi:hypothetical protein